MSHHIFKKATTYNEHLDYDDKSYHGDCDDDYKDPVDNDESNEDRM